MIHELAHICHIDQHHGLNSFFRFFVGKYVSMNAYAPQWMTEGVATYVETIMTSTGRGRSTYVDMILRLAALEGEDIHLDQGMCSSAIGLAPLSPISGEAAFISSSQTFWAR